MVAHACDVSTGEAEMVDPWGSQHCTNLLGESHASDRPCLENKVDGSGAGYLGLTSDLYPHTLPRTSTKIQMQADRQTGKQTYTQATGRHTHRHTQRQAERYTERQAGGQVCGC